MGRFAEAVAQFDAAVAMTPGVALLHGNRGASLLGLDRVREAESAYRTAIRLDPTMAEAHGNLGQLLVYRGQAGEGLTHCLEAVRLVADAPALLIDLGNAYQALHRPSEAREMYDKALNIELNAGHTAAHGATSPVLQWRAWLTEAGEGDRRALEPGPRFFDALLKQGSLREDLGDMADAEALYRWAHAIRPHAPEPLAHLALLLGDKLPQADRDAIAALVALPCPEHPGDGQSAISSDVPAAGAGAPLPPDAPMRGPLLFAWRRFSTPTAVMSGLPSVLLRRIPWPGRSAAVPAGITILPLTRRWSIN